MIAAAACIGLALLVPSLSRAQCEFSTGRDAGMRNPRLVVHFGEPQDLPGHIQSMPLERKQPELCVPLWVYNLGEGADHFELALRAPRPPLGFEPASEVLQYEARVRIDPEGTTTNLILTTAPLCGPVLLGCLRLPETGLPEQFALEVLPHQATGQRAARLGAGALRPLDVDADGAWVGPARHLCTPPDEILSPVLDLRASPGAGRGDLDISWHAGSGEFTMLRFRMDGRYPAHLRDGELLALLPSSTEHYTRNFSIPGDARIVAWSVTRGSHGFFASNVECGSQITSPIHLPVSIAGRNWGHVKSLYR